MVNKDVYITTIIKNAEFENRRFKSVIDPSTSTLKPQSNGIIYNNRPTVIGIHWPSSLLAVPNITAHPSTASVPTSYNLMWHYNYLCTLKGETVV